MSPPWESRESGSTVLVDAVVLALGTLTQESQMKRAVKVAIAICLLPSCSAIPPQQLTLPAPLEGEAVEQGRLCDPRALTQAVAHKYPSIDQLTAQQED